jgi:hypothetical protein
MGEIFTDIITDNDILNNKITMTDSPTITAKKILEYRKNVLTNIEVGIHNLFNGYIKEKNQEIKTNISTSIQEKKQIFLQIASENQSLDNIEIHANELDQTINNHLDIAIND